MITLRASETDLVSFKERKARVIPETASPAKEGVTVEVVNPLIAATCEYSKCLMIIT